MSAIISRFKNKIKAILPGSFVRYVGQVIDSRKRQKKAAVVSWCQRLAVPASAALDMITGPSSRESFFDVEHNLYQEACQRAEACPVTMGGPGNLELIYQLTKHVRAKKVVETGVAYGWSTLAFLAALDTQDPAARVFSTDRPYPDKDNKAYVGIVVPEYLAPRWQLRFGSDQDILPSVLSETGQVDICHYDSDKRYAGRMWAYPKLWQALRPGGIFISDDIGDNFAFRDFAASVSVTPIIVEKHVPHRDGLYVGILQKPE